MCSERVLHTVTASYNAGGDGTLNYNDGIMSSLYRSFLLDKNIVMFHTLPLSRGSPEGDTKASAGRSTTKLAHTKRSTFGFMLV